jgi:hypothetical protein
VTTPPRFPKGHRPQVFDDPAVDQLYAAYVAMATELAVAFDRIATLEHVMARAGTTSRAEIEAIALELTSDPERVARRAELAERLLQPFRAFREAHLEVGSRDARQPD